MRILDAIRELLRGPRVDDDRRQAERCRRVVTNRYVTSADVARRRTALASHHARNAQDYSQRSVLRIVRE